MVTGNVAPPEINPPSTEMVGGSEKPSHDKKEFSIPGVASRKNRSLLIKPVS
jgi:hypothetical protein